jgi:signal transduction histidine kinase
MNHNNQLDTLKELEKALVTVSKQTLPVETRAHIQNAQKWLKQFKRSFEKESQQGRLGALYRVSRSLGSTLDLDEVLTQAMDAVIQLTGAERGFLTLIDPETGELDMRAVRNIEQKSLQREEMKFSRTVIRSVLESGEGLVTTDAQDDPRFSGQESVVIYALRSIMCAPLRARGDVIGVIYVDNPAQSGIFSDDDLELLNTFASQAAIAIENARLYTRTDQALAARVSELEKLQQIDKELNANLDLKQRLTIALKWATGETEAVQGWIALRDAESQQHKLVIGSEKNGLPAPGKDALARIESNPEAQIVLAKGNAPVYYIAPFLHGQETIGAMIMAHPKAFSERDQHFLQRLAGRACAAVANAQLYQAVEQANAAKSQFVSIVTHELRIPLTSIKGYTDLILQEAVGEINEQQENFLQVIRNNVTRMSALISDLSDISRIERGKLRLEPEFISVKKPISDTLDGLRHKIEQKSQQIEAKLHPDLPQVYADPNRVVQVLTNLVSNAWKYSPEGGKITLRAFPKDSHVRIEVEDTGYGISEEDQENIFSQFFRSESPQIREETGWGLGLNVTRRLVEVMGGEIGFNSELGEGSTFWFTLPTEKVEMQL